MVWLLYCKVVGFWMILICWVVSGLIGVLWFLFMLDILWVLMLFFWRCIWKLFCLWMIGWLVLVVNDDFVMFGLFFKSLFSVELFFWIMFFWFRMVIGVVNLVFGCVRGEFVIIKLLVFVFCVDVLVLIMLEVSIVYFRVEWIIDFFIIF